MTNFRINFENPWFLLLLIPAAAFTLIPYFRAAKKYRRTRNRITSMALHGLVMLLAVCVLSGINFKYDVPNDKNEVILLVDKSFSSDKSNEEKDQFVYEVLHSIDDEFNVGVVTFGYDQILAAELSSDPDEVYSAYMRSPTPNGTATDIASALSYASTLFTNPEAGRIVLLSDGMETDGTAESTIKEVAAAGLKVDTVHFPDEHDNEVQLTGVTLPDKTIRHGETFELTLDLESDYEGEAVITMYDDATMIGESVTLNLIKGPQSITLEAILPIPGLHRLAFEIESASDTVALNNAYNAYVYIDVFDQLLIVESIADESESLRGIISEDMNVTVVNAGDTDAMPTTIDQMRNYDEVILVNVAKADMPKGFDELLYKYVSEIGGGLFTVCGNKEDSDPNDDRWEANAFTRTDMYNSVYQKLLPVEVIEYTPPVGVVIILDVSGSMYDPTGTVPYTKSKLYAAQQGAIAIADYALTERDYVGIMTFEENYSDILELTPRTERNKILSAIENIPKNGGATIFTSALNHAGSALVSHTDIEKKHIILITDGEPNDKEEEYGAAIKRNADLGITMSIYGIDCTSSANTLMTRALTTYAKQSADTYHNVTDLSQLASQMRVDFETSPIKEVNYGEFRPTVENYSSVTAGIASADIPTLDGFYGTKLKDGATEILGGGFVPIYAEWGVGNGRVGSFMCDLNGTWSEEFIKDENGIAIVNNIIQSLFPTESIRQSDIKLSLKEQNYNTQMNIFATVGEGEQLKVNVAQKYPSGAVQTIYPSATDGFSRVSFEVTEPGVYEIEVIKTDSEGKVISSAKTFKSFSYSKEYDLLYSSEDGEAFLSELSASSGGFALTKPHEVYANAVEYLSKTVDPGVAFVIIALVAFLLDIAVRKFKFKWLHEIIKERKAKGSAK